MTTSKAQPKVKRDKGSDTKPPKAAVQPQGDDGDVTPTYRCDQTLDMFREAV